MRCALTSSSKPLTPMSTWVLVLDVPERWTDNQWGGGELMHIGLPDHVRTAETLTEQSDNRTPKLSKRPSNMYGLLKPLAFGSTDSPVDGSARLNDATPLALLAMHLEAEMGWPRFYMNYDQLPLAERLLPWRNATRPTQSNLAKQRHDAASWAQAVGAALGLADAVLTPHTALRTLEALAIAELRAGGDPLLDYPFAIPRLLQGGQAGLPYIEPLAMWQALLGDSVLQTPSAIMAARFLRGWVNSLVRLVDQAITTEQMNRQTATDIRSVSSKMPVACVVFKGVLFDNLWLTSALEAALIARGHFVQTRPQRSSNFLAWPSLLGCHASG